MSRTRSLQDAAEEIGCTPRWLADKIRARIIPARKIAGHWRMTDDDIQYTLDRFRHGPIETIETPRQLSLTTTSARRKTA